MLSVLKFISYNNNSKSNNINRIDRINNNYIMNQNNFKDYTINKNYDLDINKLPLKTNYLGINNYNLINYNYYFKKILLNSFSIGLILGVGSAYLIEDRIPINYLGFSKYVGYKNLSCNNINNSLNLVLLYLSNFSLVTITCGLFNFNIHQYNRFQNILYYSVPIGLLTVDILHINNERDVTEDTRAGLKTTAILLGRKYSYVMHCLLLLISYGMVLWKGYTEKDYMQRYK